MRNVVKSYKYKLYDSKKNKYFDDAINIACEIWNFSIAMQQMAYKVYGKYIPRFTLEKYIIKIKYRKKWQHWRNLNAQAIQDVIQRVDRAYKLFFNNFKKNLSGRYCPPKFKKRSLYSSFTLKQNGYKFLNDNTVLIMNHKYHYFANRPFEGKVKTLTVKRTKTGEYYIIVVTNQECNDVLPRIGNAVGIDYGMKDHFLILDNGTFIDSPQWYKASMDELKTAQQALSRCKKGSNNRERARLKAAKLQEHIANQRRDWFYKLANQLVGEYAQICIEDLDLVSMRMKGSKKKNKNTNRKLNDLAYGEFITILEYIASNSGTEVIRIGRYEPSSKTCHVCGYINKELTLDQREWTCPSCGIALDRDINAAINIRELGMSKYRKAA